MLVMLRWKNLSLMAECDSDRDSEMACPMYIVSFLLGLGGQGEVAERELGSLVRSVVLLAHILLGRHQRPLERGDGRGKHLRGRCFSWLVDV
jgi:hypothetical protein